MLSLSLKNVNILSNLLVYFITRLFELVIYFISNINPITYQENWFLTLITLNNSVHIYDIRSSNISLVDSDKILYHY